MITEGLKLYLPFYDYRLQGVTFNSLDENEFIVTPNTTSYDPTGRVFDASSTDFLTIPHSSVLSFSPSFATVLWCKPALTGGFITLLAKDGVFANVNTNYQIDITNTGKVRFAFRDTASEGHVWQTTSVIITNSIQACLAVTYTSSGNPIIYKDGTPEGGVWEIGSGGILCTNSNSLYIGKINEGTGNLYSGVIGELRLYDTVPDADSISADYRESLRNYFTCWDFFSWA